MSPSPTASDLLVLRTVRAHVRAGTAKAVRVAAGLSVAEVARAAQVSQRTISRWEAGQTVPHGPAALRYGSVLAALLRSEA